LQYSECVSVNVYLLNVYLLSYMHPAATRRHSSAAADFCRLTHT